MTAFFTDGRSTATMETSVLKFFSLALWSVPRINIEKVSVGFTGAAALAGTFFAAALTEFWKLKTENLKQIVTANRSKKAGRAGILINLCYHIDRLTICHFEASVHLSSRESVRGISTVEISRFEYLEMTGRGPNASQWQSLITVNHKYSANCEILKFFLLLHHLESPDGEKS